MRLLLGPIVRPILYARLGEAGGRRILGRTWELYPAQLAAVDDTARLGVRPALVMGLSACVIALHAALTEAGASHGEALGIAGDVAWAVYPRMGKVPWLLGGFVSRDPARRLGIATRLFRTFCDLDFPLAADWSATLVREGSIAAGAAVCDFRWTAGAPQQAADAQQNAAAAAMP